MPKAHRDAIYEHLFKEGVMVAKKDFNAPKHPELTTIPNLHVIKTMQSLQSKGLVRSQFAWRHYYWYVYIAMLPVTLVTIVDRSSITTTCILTIVFLYLILPHTQVLGERGYWVSPHILAFAIGNRSIDIEARHTLRASSCPSKCTSPFRRCQQDRRRSFGLQTRSRQCQRWEEGWRRPRRCWCWIRKYLQIDLQ